MDTEIVTFYTYTSGINISVNVLGSIAANVLYAKLQEGNFHVINWIPSNLRKYAGRMLQVGEVDAMQFADLEDYDAVVESMCQKLGREKLDKITEDDLQTLRMPVHTECSLEECQSWINSNIPIVLVVKDDDYEEGDEDDEYQIIWMERSDLFTEI